MQLTSVVVCHKGFERCSNDSCRPPCANGSLPVSPSDFSARAVARRLPWTTATWPLTHVTLGSWLGRLMGTIDGDNAAVWIFNRTLVGNMDAFERSYSRTLQYVIGDNSLSNPSSSPGPHPKEKSKQQIQNQPFLVKIRQKSSCMPYFKDGCFQK